MARKKRWIKGQTREHSDAAAAGALSPLAATVGFGWLAWSCFDRREDFLRAAQTFANVPETVLQTNLAALARFLPSLAALALLFFMAAACGRLLFRVFRLRDADSFEETILSLGLGLGGFSLLGLFLGLAGSLTAGAIGAVTVAASVASLAMNRLRPWRPVPHAPVAVPFQDRFMAAATGCLLCALILINLIGALSPEIFYDSLVYHLALPKLYLLHRRIFPTPYNIYSGVPMNTEMLYAIGMALGGETLAKLIPWGVSLTLLAAVFAWGRRYATRDAALLAALLLYSCPMLSAQVWQCLVELNWCLFGFLSVYALLRGLEPNVASPRRWMALAGVFAGVAFGVKYNAAALAVILPLPLLRRWLRSSPRPPVRKLLGETGLVVGMMSLTASPWFLKNLYFYANPIFPFFNELFAHAPPHIDWRGLLLDAHRRDWTTTFTTSRGFLDLSTSLFHGQAPLFDSIGLAWLLFLPWAFLGRRLSAPYRDLTVVCLASWATWALSSRMPRFFIFALPGCALLVAMAIASPQAPVWRRRLLGGALLVGCLVSCAEILYHGQLMGGWRVVFGAIPKADYLERTQPFYPTPYFAATEFVNKTLPADAKILFMGEARGYYCERDFIAASSFAPDPFAVMVAQSQNAKKLLGQLRELGVTHLLMNREEAIRRHISLFFEDQPWLYEVGRDHLRKVFDRKSFDPKDPRWVEVYEVRY